MLLSSVLDCMTLSSPEPDIVESALLSLNGEAPISLPHAALDRDNALPMSPPTALSINESCDSTWTVESIRWQRRNLNMSVHGMQELALVGEVRRCRPWQGRQIFAQAELYVWGYQNPSFFDGLRL